MTKLALRTVTITPAMAYRMLLMNKRNRPLDEKRAYRLSEAIKRGEWQMNGDTIRISESGIVLDGQHRLRAIQLSGVSVETIIVEGLPDNVFSTIDTNARTRNAADIFAIKGEKNYTTLAAATSLYYKYINTGNPYYANSKEHPTTQQIELTLEQNSGLKECVNYCSSQKWIKAYITSSAAAFALYVFQKIDKQKANEFFAKLETGAGLEQTSPILLLRDRLVIEKTDSKTTLSKTYKMALIFRAFKYFLNGSSVKQLKVVTDGYKSEKDIFKL